MSVFNEGMLSEASMPMKAEKCRRDYEAEIEALQKRKFATSHLLEAMDLYLDVYGRYGRDQFTLPSLYGSLMLEMKEQGKIIEQLQAAWEQEK